MFDLWLPMVSFSIALIISPGPGNALLAANGASFGYKKTIPFLMGFDSANLILSLIYGFGLVSIFKIYPTAYTIFKVVGSIYIFYLAYKFFTSSSVQQKKGKVMNFKDGFIVVFLNPKIHSMFPLLYSQFINPSEALEYQVITITLIFVILCLICHSVWIIGGDLIFRKFQSDKQIRIQNVIFGSMIFIVGVYILLN